MAKGQKKNKIHFFRNNENLYLFIVGRRWKNKLHCYYLNILGLLHNHIVK